MLQAGQKEKEKEDKGIFMLSWPGRDCRYCLPAHHPLPCASTDYSQSYLWEATKTSSAYLPLRIRYVSLVTRGSFPSAAFHAIGSLLLSQGGEEVSPPYLVRHRSQPMFRHMLAGPCSCLLLLLTASAKR